MTEANKRINLRYPSLADFDLIQAAAAQSGLPVSEWTRRATIRVAEEQIHNSGVSVMLLKNIYLIRRILELSALVTPDQLREAEEWASIRGNDAMGIQPDLVLSEVDHD